MGPNKPRSTSGQNGSHLPCYRSWAVPSLGANRPGRLWTPTDMGAFCCGMYGRPWTPLVDVRIKRSGDSSPSGRATHIGTYAPPSGLATPCRMPDTCCPASLDCRSERAGTRRLQRRRPTHSTARSAPRSDGDTRSVFHPFLLDCCVRIAGCWTRT